MSAKPTSRCPGCGLKLPRHDGPTHPYMGASSACWARYGQLLAREYGPLGMPAVHRLTVDAYAVQHPGVPERRTIQSVAAHLIALHLVLDRGEPPTRVTDLLGRLLPRLPELRWLTPPEPNGTRTVVDVLTADRDGHADAVTAWAGDIWRAWTPHHPVVVSWLDAATVSSRHA
jgi:hypothetical protein